RRADADDRLRAPRASARLDVAGVPGRRVRGPGGGAVSAALMVVGHGSRDADGVEEFWELASHVRAAAGELPTGFGFIEMAEPPVDAGIDELVLSGASDVVSVPLVLLAAGHLKNDGPAALSRARMRHPGVAFRMGRDLGIDPVVLAVAEDRARE